MSNEITKDEKLALLKALSKKLEPELKELESEKKHELAELNEQYGADRIAIKVGNTKVGEIGMNKPISKPVIDPFKKALALDYLYKAELVEMTPKKGWEKRFAKAGEAIIDTETGEIVDGFLWDERPGNLVFRGCKPDEVIEAFQGRLNPAIVNNLLMEGNND